MAPPETSSPDSAAAPSVAILLPTLNAAQDLSRLLPALAEQRPRAELIAVDSSSTDDTVALLEAAGFRVASIERRDFGHGKTRNLLASLTEAEFLVFLSQDATPASFDFLEELLKPFEDTTVGGVIARVLPNPGDDPLTARTVLSSPEASTERTTRRWSDPETYESMSPAERADLLRFNNVASCIRRKALLSIPFPEVPFGEDFAWALRALASGWALHFEPNAVVYHAHSYGPMDALRRYRTDAVFHREFYGAQIRPSLLSAVKGGLYEVKEDLRHLAKIGPGARGFWRALLRSPLLRLAQTYGQYQGSSIKRSPGVDADAWRAARSAGAVGLASSHPESQCRESQSSESQSPEGGRRFAGGRP